MIYSCFSDYLETIASLEAKIVKIDEIIDKLDDSILRVAEKGEIANYSLDSGQSKVNVQYRTVTQIENSITALERRKNRYESKLCGRKTRLRSCY